MNSMRIEGRSFMMQFPITRFVFALGALLSFFLATQSYASSASASAGGALITFGTDQPETNFVGKWQRRIYTEAFSRLGMRVSFAQFPPPRLNAEVNSGSIDGEVTRTYEYGNANPELVRAEESVFNIVFAIYTANPSLQAEGLKSLPANAIGEYRRGVLGCENALKPVVAAAQLSDILTTEQGLKKLIAKRTDFYCDIDLAVLNEMTGSKISEFAATRKLFDVGISTPLYPYFHKKNAALAPRLATVLKQMKAEGLIDRFRSDALREFGYK